MAEAAVIVQMLKGEFQVTVGWDSLSVRIADTLRGPPLFHSVLWAMAFGKCLQLHNVITVEHRPKLTQDEIQGP